MQTPHTLLKRKRRDSTIGQLPVVTPSQTKLSSNISSNEFNRDQCTKQFFGYHPISFIDDVVNSANV